MGCVETLSKLDAVNSARDALAENMALPAKAIGFSQMRWLVDQLALACADEALRRDGSEDALNDIVNVTLEVLHSVWSVGAPEIATRFRWKEDDKPTEEEQKTIDRARSTVWTRHDPRRAFQEGYESAHHVDTDKETMAEIVALYLQNSWLHLPYLDWVLVDMTVSRELSAYGEALKQKIAPGNRDLLGFNDRYFQSKGNLSKMIETRWPEVWEKLWAKVFWFLIVPIGAIWLAFRNNWTVVGTVLLVLYSLVIGFRVLIGLARWGKRTVNHILGRPDPKTKPFILWDQMYEVWRRLEGPVVNPTIVREAMVKSSEHGAVWDTVTWSLLDRVISIDPAVWIVRPNNA